MDISHNLFLFERLFNASDQKYLQTLARIVSEGDNCNGVEDQFRALHTF